MVWNRDGNRRVLKPLLHHDMAASLTYFQKPVVPRILQTCFLERTRSLPNRYLHLRHVHFLMQACLNFIRRSSFEK